MPVWGITRAMAAIHHKGLYTRRSGCGCEKNSRPRYMPGTNTRASQSEIRLGAKSQLTSRGLPGVATAVVTFYPFFGRLSAAPRNVLS
jgi:hypothetical protein